MSILDFGPGFGKSPRPVSIPKTYQEIKSKCLARETLWEDPDFPAVPSSIFQNQPSVVPKIQWKRPKEICCHAKLFVDGASRGDIVQGELDNHQLVAAVANLTTNSALLHKVIPPDQSFDDEYAGVIRFQFWQYGRWVEVLIDDRLPTYDNKLIYMHSKNRHEFWAALLGKAFAKLHGSYEALNSGLGTSFIIDITGAFVRKYELKSNAARHLFQIMLKAQYKGWLMNCIIIVPAGKRGNRLSNGLISGHSCRVTDVRTVQILHGRETIQMVRVRNPWSYADEWKGAWSVGSQEWKTVSDDEKPDPVDEHNGEFWMSYKDFVSNFDRLEICMLAPDDDDPSETHKWKQIFFEGAWQRGVNAGGCMDYKSTFWTNPQYRVTISGADSDDEDQDGSITIELTQKQRRQKKGGGNLKIGYTVFQVFESDPSTLTAYSQSFFDRPVVARSKVFTDKREVTCHHELPSGKYVIVPSTLDPNEEGEFTLRIFTERHDDEAVELDQSTPTIDPVWPPTLVWKLTITIRQFRDWAGADNKMNTFELLEFLNNTFLKGEIKFAFGGFTKDMARILISMYDTDFSGKLGFEQFIKLWKEILICANVFIKMDVDRNGYLCTCEFRNALNALNYLGFRVNNTTFTLIVIKYSDKDGFMRFDDFVNCYFEMKTNPMFWRNSVGGRTDISKPNELPGSGSKQPAVVPKTPPKQQLWSEVVGKPTVVTKTPPKQQWSQHAGKYRVMPMSSTMADETQNDYEVVQKFQAARRSMMEDETQNGHAVVHKFQAARRSMMEDETQNGHEVVQEFQAARRSMMEDETQNGQEVIQEVAQRSMMEDDIQNEFQVFRRDEDAECFNPWGYPNHQWIQ